MDNAPQDLIPGKMAQLRLYDHLLTPEEVMQVHSSAIWPGGNPVQQCVSYDSKQHSAAYMDSNDVDLKGRPCAWYADNLAKYPHICSSLQAKNMCPVTCHGARVCHDGSLSERFEKRKVGTRPL